MRVTAGANVARNRATLATTVHPGTIVGGRYALEHLAGAGGMGTVYRARDITTNTPIALKVVRTMTPRATRRFLQEAELLASLEHPNIVRYLAHGTMGEDALFLALEWIEGESLADLVERRGMRVKESIALAHALAGALGLVHARGIVHRDIKPTNVLLTRDEQGNEVPKLVDFGIARVVGGEALTRPGAAVGTPAWMSPEQARGLGEVDARSDVFSLGALLFTCLTGRPPFDAEHAIAMVAKVLLGEAPRLLELRSDLPSELDALVASMLARDPDQRPGSGAEVELKLSRLLHVDGAPPPPLVALSSMRETIGSTGDGTPAPDDVLGAREQRLLCAVLASGPFAACHRAIDALAAVHGAAVDRLGLDGFVATIRGHGSATDHAGRAGRLALALRDAVPGVRLALVTGTADSASSSPIGVVVERGARLLAESSSGVRIDQVTSALIDRQFEISVDEHGLLVASERTTLDAPRLLLGKPTPFVGRARELRFLEDFYREGVDEGEARVTLVTGNPGIGKSRLRHELLEKLGASVDKLRTWLGEGDPMRFGAPFSLIAPLVRNMAGIVERDLPEVRRRKLTARVARSVPGEKGIEVAEFLGEISGLPFPDAGNPRLLAARQAPLLLADRVRDAFREFVGAELQRGPILLVLEDVHWGDLPSLRLVDQLLAAHAHAPLLVLALGRLEVEKLFPDLWLARRVQPLRLGELSARAAQTLVRDVLGAEADDSLVEHVVKRAEGNAFYLEEVIRAVAEGRTEELPETVLAMAQSRLDALATDARRVLRACSVFGDGFGADAVATLLAPIDVREVALRLDDLTEREVLLRRETPGAVRYAFRHALLREGAYATLTAEDRTRAHQLALEWLCNDERAEPLVLAEHAERAGEHSIASEMLLRAARDALAANDFAAAIARAKRGLEHGARGHLRAALLVVQGQAHAFRNEWALVAENEAALELAAKGSATWCTAAAGILWARLELGEPERVLPILIALQSTEPEPDARAVFVSTLAIVIPLLGWLGQHVLAGAFLARLDAIELARDELVARGWVHLARANHAGFARNDTYRSIVELRRAVELAARGGDRATLHPLAMGALGEAMRAIARREETERLQREVLADTSRSGLEFIAGFSRGYLARAQLARGQHAHALA
ncbi:MAG: protein kinase, partial [Sandaracinaceae bacterium]|nr:protein kinase [Sandaracinaceae bacterium]